MIRTSTTATALALLLALSGCGGSSTDSGSSSDNGNGGNPWAGRYAGNMALTLSIAGERESASGPAVTEIDRNGNVKVGDGSTPTSTVGKMNGNKFTARGRFEFSDGAVSCRGTEEARGTMSTGRVDGTISANGSCTGFGRTLPLKISGNFGGKKQGNSRAAKGNLKRQALQMFRNQVGK